MTHQLSRRDFLKIGVAGLATSVLAGCQNPRRWVTLEPYVKPPEEQLAGQATWYASTCRQCPAGCGIIVRVMNGRALKIEGNPEHPISRGKLCPRGQAGLQLLYNPDRLQGPVIQSQRGSRNYRPVSWNEALNTLSTKLAGAGKNVVFWGGSTTSAHVIELAGLLTRAAGGSAPMVWDLFSGYNDYPAYQAAHQAQYGQPGLAGYDLSHSDVVFSFGGNFLGPWLNTTRYGVEFGGFRGRAAGQRGYLIQLEPRLSMSGVKADRWLSILPGSDAMIAQAMVRLIADNNFGPAERINAAKSMAANVDLNAVAQASGLSTQELTNLARVFAEASHPVAIPGPALAGQFNAAESINAVEMLNQITGQGGASGVLADAPLPVQGLSVKTISPYGDVLKLVDAMRGGQVQALLVSGANPLYDLPAKTGILDAIKKVPLVVSFAPIIDETAVWADMVLPERTYLETWGYEVVSPNFGMPVVDAQQPVVSPLYDTRSVADILIRVAKTMPSAAGAIPWNDEVGYLQQAISKLPAGNINGTGAVQWAGFLQHGGWWPAAAPAAAPTKAPAVTAPAAIGSPQIQGGAQDYPYYLHVFMSELLSDGRGASQPWLVGSPDPTTTLSWQTWVEIHPDTAKKIGVKDGDIVKITSPQGEIEALVYTYPAIRPDTVAIPTGLGHTDYGRYAENRGSNPVQLLGAQADASGSGMGWAAWRVKITPTGRRKTLALFENKDGVMHGFPKASLPGQ